MAGYPGQTQTLSDLYYNRYRDYDSSLGRYIQADPIGLGGGSNPYVYANNNPLRWTDPEGQLSSAVTTTLEEVLPDLLLETVAKPSSKIPVVGEALMIGTAIGTGIAVGEFVYKHWDDKDCDDDGPCEVQKEKDEFECNQWNARASWQGYSRTEGYKLCLSSAMQRYGECRAARGIHGIRTELFLPGRRRGIEEPKRPRGR
jgi:RHS repeat-associated protein